MGKIYRANDPHHLSSAWSHGEETIIGGEASAADEAFEDMPSGKRTAVRIVSAILFILLAAAVIFGVDAITGWIKSMF